MRAFGVLVGVAAFVGSATIAASAEAQVVENEYADYPAPETERRGGFTIGLGAGAGFGSFSGFPNKLSEIGDPELEQNVDGFAFGNAVWLGGTLRDWIGFGLGLSMRGASEGDLTASNQAFIIHLEGFPLYGLGGEWRDVGIAGNFGAGGALINDGSDDVADGGIMSVLGLGVFYEPWKFWHFSTGPSLDYTHEFSESLRSNTVTLGMRFVFYGKQPR